MDLWEMGCKEVKWIDWLRTVSYV